MNIYLNLGVHIFYSIFQGTDNCSTYYVYKKLIIKPRIAVWIVAQKYTWYFQIHNICIFLCETCLPADHMRILLIAVWCFVWSWWYSVLRSTGMNVIIKTIAFWFCRMLNDPSERVCGTETNINKICFDCAFPAVSIFIRQSEWVDAHAYCVQNACECIRIGEVASVKSILFSHFITFSTVFGAFPKHMAFLNDFMFLVSNLIWNQDDRFCADMNFFLV